MYDFGNFIFDYYGCFMLFEVCFGLSVMFFFIGFYFYYFVKDVFNLEEDSLFWLSEIIIKGKGIVVLVKVFRSRNRDEYVLGKEMKGKKLRFCWNLEGEI